jgi:hypothetical protein
MVHRVMDEYVTMTLEHRGKSASIRITEDALADEAIVGRFVTARLLPALRAAKG